MPEVGVCAKPALVPMWTPADKIRPNRSSSQGMLVTGNTTIFHVYTILGVTEQ